MSLDLSFHRGDSDCSVGVLAIPRAEIYLSGCEFLLCCLPFYRAMHYSCGGFGFGGLSMGFSAASSDGLPPSFNPSPSISPLSWGSDPPRPREVELPMRVRGGGCAEVSSSQSVYQFVDIEVLCLVARDVWDFSRCC